MKQILSLAIIAAACSNQNQSSEPNTDTAYQLADVRMIAYNGTTQRFLIQDCGVKREVKTRSECIEDAMFNNLGLREHELRYAIDELLKKNLRAFSPAMRADVVDHLYGDPIYPKVRESVAVVSEKINSLIEEIKKKDFHWVDKAMIYESIEFFIVKNLPLENEALQAMVRHFMYVGSGPILQDLKSWGSKASEGLVIHLEGAERDEVDDPYENIHQVSIGGYTLRSRAAYKVMDPLVTVEVMDPQSNLLYSAKAAYSDTLDIRYKGYEVFKSALTTASRFKD